MKRTIKTIFTTAATMLALASCQKLPSVGVSSYSDNEIRFLDAGILVETKAFSEATANAIQEDGFNVAAIIDDGNIEMFNKAVAYSKGAYSVPGEHYYWPASGTMSFYGVYPKTQAISVTSGVAALSYSHDTDTDLIAAKVTAIANQSTGVTMAFNHLLSQVQIKVQGKETTVDYKVFSIKITDANGGTYAYTDGTWTLSPTTQEYTVYNDASGKAVSTSSMEGIGSSMSFMPGDAKLNVVWKCYSKGTSTVLCEKDVTVNVNLPQGKNSTLNLTLPFDSSYLTFDSSVGAWVDASKDIKMEEPVFTVNDSGKKVKFAPGNLYWNGSEFKFEEHQYDYRFEYNPNHQRTFFWSKDARVAYAEDYDAANTEFGITPRYNDKFFAADGGAIEGYTVLTSDEWKYLLDNATAMKPSNNDKRIRIGNSNVCVILKPDGFNGTIADSYTKEEWAVAEESYGLVAMPLIGSYRVPSGSSPSTLMAYFNYWSSTIINDEKAKQISSSSSGSSYFYFSYEDAPRKTPCAVRLVQVVQ